MEDFLQAKAKIKKIAIIYGGMRNLSEVLGRGRTYIKDLIYRKNTKKLIDTIRQCEMLHLADKNGEKVKWKS